MPSATIDRLWNGADARPGEAVRLDATLTRTVLRVSIDAPFHDDPTPDLAPGRAPGLWNHEVVELFLVGRNDRYVELEFGPHGHFLALRLAGRRQVVTDTLKPAYRATIHGNRWNGRAEIPRAQLPDPILRWNAFAIHGEGRDRRYLAAHPVPGAAPDFHRLDAFPTFG